MDLCQPTASQSNQQIQQHPLMIYTESICNGQSVVDINAVQDAHPRSTLEPIKRASNLIITNNRHHTTHHTR